MECCLVVKDSDSPSNNFVESLLTFSIFSISKICHIHKYNYPHIRDLQLSVAEEELTLKLERIVLLSSMLVD